jgi:hypothetical protein
MLYGKINPPASTVHQSTPFSSTTETADLMMVIARPYILGSTKVNFEVVFGNGDISGNTVTNFRNILSSNTTLGKSSLESWGLDDSIILSEVAAQMGTNIIEVLTGATNNGARF